MNSRRLPIYARIQQSTSAATFALTLLVPPVTPIGAMMPPPLRQLPDRPLLLSQATTVSSIESIEPRNAADFLKQGVAKTKMNDLEGAIADFTKAIQLKRDYAAAYYNRGTTYANVGRPRDAIADYTQVILLKPNNAYVRYDRGLIRADLGDQKGAIADLQQAASLFQQQLNRSFQQKALAKVKALQAQAE